jgi:hypothetical protein
MNLNSPFLTPAFNGGTTSALSRIPTPFHSFPGGNIGYANRLEGVGDWRETLIDVFEPIGDVFKNVTKTFLEAQLGRARTEALKAAGYQFGEVVEITTTTGKRQGVKAKRPDGTWWVVFPDGSEIAFTQDVQTRSAAVSSTTGLTSGSAILIGAVAIGAIALLLFKRR